MAGEDPRIVELLAAARQERAPDHLHARVAELRRQRPAPAQRVRPAWSLGTAAALAVVVLALLFALPAGTPGAPSISQAAALGLKAPSAAAPAADPSSPWLLQDRVGRLSFPRWSDWRVVGRRTDRLDGRRIETVYYERSGKRVAYTIVAGAPLGATHETFTVNGHVFYTWRQQHHTCILSGVAVPTLISLSHS